MPDTLGDMQASIQRWMREPVDAALAADAINDAIESLWQSVVTFQLHRFLGGPISLALPTGAERAAVVSVADPASGPTADAVAGGSLGARSVEVAFTLATESGTETNLSPAVSVGVGANQLVQAQPPLWVAGAMGWNCYMGPDSAGMARQNEEPLDFAASFTEAPAGYAAAPDAPAPPAMNTTGDNIAAIKHMELQMPDGSWRAWEQADIDSEVFRRAAASMADGSSYQYYAYDFVNGNTVEVRPALGAAFSPRYFYVVKPRRMRFPNAQMPFAGVPHQAFIRYSALAAISLSLFEQESAAAWLQSAEGERTRILQALTAGARNRNTRSVPYLMA